MLEQFTWSGSLADESQHAVHTNSAKSHGDDGGSKDSKRSCPPIWTLQCSETVVTDCYQSRARFLGYLITHYIHWNTLHTIHPVGNAECFDKLMFLGTAIMTIVQTLSCIITEYAPDAQAVFQPMTMAPGSSSSGPYGAMALRVGEGRDILLYSCTHDT